MLNLGDHLAGCQLGIAEDLVQIAHRSTRYTGCAQPADPVAARLLAERAIKDRFQLSVPRDTRPVGREPPIVFESGGRTETAPLIIVAASENKIAVRRRED